MARLRSHVALALALLPLCATTLERMTVDQMIDKSTSVIRVRTISSRTEMLGRMIYTLNRVQVTDRWKGQGYEYMDVAIPGGSWNGYRQMVPGAPRMNTGGEYVIFVWTAPNGVNHVVGLSQGLLQVTTAPNGATLLVRGRTDAEVLDSQGKPVDDTGVQITLADLLARLGK
jgi:hypothetical protein